MQKEERKREEIKERVFNSEAIEKEQQVGGQYHKCVTMRRICSNLMVADDAENKVAFFRPDSLAKVATINYQTEGYLSGAIGIEFNKKPYAYLWFSSGEVILIDPMTTKQLSKSQLDVQIKCALHFNSCEKILFGCDKGTLIVCEGHQFNKITMSKKIVIE